MKKVQDYIEEILDQEYPGVPDERFTESEITTLKRNLLRAQLERLVAAAELQALNIFDKD